MAIEYISAISALAGSVIGGLTTAFTGWIAERARRRAQQLGHTTEQREGLYRDFIAAASKTYGNALLSSEPQLEDLIALYAMISRMRMLSEPGIVACADKIMLTIIDTYFSPNQSLQELREQARTGRGIDPLKEFSEAAREEMLGWHRLR
jgi:hypothetical protein